MLEASRAVTPKDTLYRDGRGSVYRFRRPGGQEPESPRSHAPVLLVPSMLHQWYVLDLCKGASVASALSRTSPWDTFCLDWGVPEDEDRYVDWDHIVGRLERAIRFVQRSTGEAKVVLIGYSMGATLSAIAAARNPGSVAAFVNIAGPIDFSESGGVGTMIDSRWFDAAAVSSAGNIGKAQMQAGFFALRPLETFSRHRRAFENRHDPAARAAFEALETWINDTVPFPAAAYVTFIEELYQQNRLVRGEHRVRGELVDLSRITCPHLSVVADRDGVCPAASTTALDQHTRSAVKDTLHIHGGHVGAVTGPQAETELYPQLVAWLETHAAKATRTTS
ncbi:MAG: Polyhydroxyalkanoic acid synthase [Labilithrix sp.]|nr:Polyhydroxyalkanoic acid synthase [Labilithrix sp.]